MQSDPVFMAAGMYDVNGWPEDRRQGSGLDLVRTNTMFE